MEKKIYSDLNKIIERDSKASTYKFALLRGVIEIILDNSPYLEFKKGRVLFPTGLLMEKWLIYYYPIFNNPFHIPQINGNTNLAFATQLEAVTYYYKDKGGFSSFFNDLKSIGIPGSISPDFLRLLKKLYQTIKEMPMRYLGRSVYEDYYSIFSIEKGASISPKNKIDVQFIINSFGVTSFPLEYYEVFKVLGSYIIGQESILFKWAEFSVNASGKKLSHEKALEVILESPITEREINASKSFYMSILKKEGMVKCVWSGDRVNSYDIDHLIPFSIWKNNDLWNLLPATKTINNNKRNKIPSADLIEKRKDSIIHYWELIYNFQKERFEREIQVSLLGNRSFNKWQFEAINQLKSSCNYLILTRGFEEWEL